MFMRRQSRMPFELSREVKPELDVRDEQQIKSQAVSANIEINLAYIRKRYRVGQNSDVVIREMTAKSGKSAFVVFFDGMVYGEYIDNAVIKPLLELEGFDEPQKRATTHSQMQALKDMDAVCDEINFGSCALFIDGIEDAFVFDVRGWEHRGISKPENEQSIYGPAEAFAEMLRANTALVRKIVKTEKLIALDCKVGKESKTRGVLMYIEDIANDKLVREAKRRIDSIAVDYIISSEQVQMLIEDGTLFLTPQIIATERPDRAARALSEGRCVFLLSGSPRALILPCNAFELIQAASDEYLNKPFAVMSRIIRFTGMLLSLLLPAMYLAATLYHREIIPTYLLYSISASRENVPFPSLVEMLLMDISFELIREAGIRMPSPIGPTLSIVGGLILGQAAVSAKIVSPIMIIIIAITGIGSFETADYSLGWTFRILRQVFIVAAACFGFFGIAVGMVVYSLYMGSITTFGIRFLSPLPRFGGKSMASTVMIRDIEKREKRPEFLKTKRVRSEPEISKRWSVWEKGRKER